MLRSLLHGRAAPPFLAWTLLVAATACTQETPASTPAASAPAHLFRHESVNVAWRRASEDRRPLVVMFTSDHCPHCERMLRETYADPDIQRLLAEHAETVLAHAAKYPDLVKRLNIRGYPTTLIVAADGQIVDAVEGFVDARAFARRLAPWVGPTAQARVCPDDATGPR